ncbi:ParB N-terminal domain-containing protein [Methylorubrum extorquens]|uniref:plasmid partitioning protein RepB C-terminal domain-containing protein n=1 Tax=Methylorubrum extorquens TaxID=408 RepID=UPI0022381719|nr:plasmid partitioning protein RepB C-terminal domain-containing protein [Methylorubrum extorquens]UYW27507.1 ParB N-terminal domain-containing protein [Methylorubrum extorquens]
MSETGRKAFVLGFEPEIVVVPIAALMPVKTLRPTVKASHKYTQIAQSIREIGVVEPPVIARDAAAPGRYLLLDGHLRVEILKDAGHTEVECLVSTDDEAFTYNRNISRISPVMERAMIVRAIERGVPQEKIAAAMSMDVVSIKRRVKILDGICEEVVLQLADRHCPLSVFDILRKMKPLRQMAAADLMIQHNNFSVAYASAILAGTPQSELHAGAKAKPKGVTPAAMARMERELENLQMSVGAIQETFSRDNLHLTVAKGYLGRLLANQEVHRFLAARYPDLLESFLTVAEVTSTLPADEAA